MTVTFQNNGTFDFQRHGDVRLTDTSTFNNSGIVEKTVAYASTGEVGPWRRRVLWITNEQEGSRRRSDTLAASLEARGFSSRKV